MGKSLVSCFFDPQCSSSTTMAQSLKQTVHSRGADIIRPKFFLSKSPRQLKGAQHHKAPQYMTDCSVHTSDTARRQHLPGGR